MKAFYIFLFCTTYFIIGCSSPGRFLSSTVNNDPHADFHVYTDNAGLKYYEFDQIKRTHDDAKEHCADKELRLMTEHEAKRLKNELNANDQRLNAWLGEELTRDFWTSSKIGVVLDGKNMPGAIFIGANPNGAVIAFNLVDRLTVVRCVGR